MRVLTTHPCVVSAALTVLAQLRGDNLAELCGGSCCRGNDGGWDGLSSVAS
jgi:hypothetical protein